MPTLKSEKGKLDPSQPKDSKAVDLIEQTPFYKKHEDAIVQTRDAMGYILYAALGMLLALSTWINLERGDFPFNVDMMAKVAYWKQKPGTPLFAFGIGLLFAMLMVYSKRKVVRGAEATIAESFTQELGKRGHLRKIKPI
jgi:hypothetical protein